LAKFEILSWHLRGMIGETCKMLRIIGVGFEIRTRHPPIMKQSLYNFIATSNLIKILPSVLDLEGDME
jgi:hypothetical protein